MCLGGTYGGGPEAGTPGSCKVAWWLRCHSSRLWTGLMTRELWFLSVKPAWGSNWGGVWAPCPAEEPVCEASLCGGERLGGKEL